MRCSKGVRSRRVMRCEKGSVWTVRSTVIHTTGCDEETRLCSLSRAAVLVSGYPDNVGSDPRGMGGTRMYRGAHVRCVGGRPDRPSMFVSDRLVVRARIALYTGSSSEGPTSVRVLFVAE